MITYKFRLYPTEYQQLTIQKYLSVCKDAYNKCLETRKTAWETEQKNVSNYDCHKLLTQWKKEFGWSFVYSSCLLDACDRLDKAYKSFFRRCKTGEKAGFPKFKSWKYYDSFTYKSEKDRVKINNNSIHFPKLGKIKARLHRQIEGSIKTTTVKCDKVGKYWVTIVTDFTPPAAPTPKDAVGIDLGIVHFATLSDGTVIENPKTLNEHLKRLKKCHNKLSKTKKCSKERDKVKRSLNRVYSKITNIRNDFLQKLTTKLSESYSLIAIEDLNIKNMVEDSNKTGLNRAIHDVSWGKFIELLEQKCLKTGCTLVKVDPAYTSQTCSQCGYCNKDNRVSQSEFECLSCDFEENADYNGSLNILRKALT